MYGSVATDLFLPYSDVDIAVTNIPQDGETWKDCEAWREDDHESWKRCALHALEKQMMEIGFPAFYLEAILSATVPLVKLTQAPNGLQADITVIGRDELHPRESAEFLKWAFNAEKEQAIATKRNPRMRDMILVFKGYLENAGYHEAYSGGVSSFLASCLVIHFFQKFGDTFTNDFGKIVLRFFQYFGKEFDYENYGIRVHKPPGLYQRPQEELALLSLESPVVPGTDMGIKVWDFHNIQEAFSQTFDHLNSSLAGGNSKDPFSFVLDWRIINSWNRPLPDKSTARRRKGCRGKQRGNGCRGSQALAILDPQTKSH